MLLWEAGACSGAALAQKVLGAATARLNVSIAYGLTEDECPDPLRGDQIILGIKRDRMKQLLYQILDAHNISSDLQRTACEHMQEILDHYIAAVNIALLLAPSLVTEANVQDWLSRLVKLAQSERYGVTAPLRMLTLLRVTSMARVGILWPSPHFPKSLANPKSTPFAEGCGRSPGIGESPGASPTSNGADHHRNRQGVT